jgi:hypothetical protein
VVLATGGAHIDCRHARAGVDAIRAVSASGFSLYLLEQGRHLLWSFDIALLARHGTT